MPILGTVASSYRSAAGGATYELITSSTLTANTTLVTISSIPSTYTDLVVKIFFATDRAVAATAWDDVRVRFNGDTGTNYSGRLIWASGSSPTQQGEPTTYFVLRPPIDGTSAIHTNLWDQAEIYIAGYTSTTKFKTAISHDSSVFLTNTSGTGIWQHGTVWLNSTSAISSISFEQWSNPVEPIASGSVFSLYGILKA